MPAKSENIPVIKARSSKASSKKEPEKKNMEEESTGESLKIRRREPSDIARVSSIATNTTNTDISHEPDTEGTEIADLGAMKNKKPMFPAVEYMENPALRKVSYDVNEEKKEEVIEKPVIKRPASFERNVSKGDLGVKSDFGKNEEIQKVSTSSARAVPPVPARYSTRRKEARHDNSTIRKVLVFLVIVIAAGVGLSFLLRDVITNGTQSGNTTSTSSISSVSTSTLPSILLVDVETKDESLASNVTSNSDYTITSLSLGSSQNSSSGAMVGGISINRYTSFVRVVFNLSGVETGLPPTTFSYDNTNKEITMSVSGMSVSDTGLLTDIDVNVGTLRAITGSLSESDVLTFVFGLDDQSKYHVSFAGSELVLDIKTLQDLNELPTASSATSTASTSTVSSSLSSAPSDGVSYDNNPSQKKQYVVSNVEGRKLYNENYYYEDTGPSFQFSWAMRGSTEDSIPNAEAEIVNIDGTSYIQLTIHNLFVDLLYATGKTEPNIKISLLGSPIAKIELKSYDINTATSTYLVQLRYRSNFRLHATETEGDYRLLSLQVFD